MSSFFKKELLEKGCISKGGADHTMQMIHQPYWVGGGYCPEISKKKSEMPLLENSTEFSLLNEIRTKITLKIHLFLLHYTSWIR